MKKLPGFDNHILVENYKLSDKESDNNVNSKDVEDSDKQDSKSESSNDTKNGDNDGQSEQEDKKESDDKTKDSDVGASNPDGAGGKGGLIPGLTDITDKTYEKIHEKVVEHFGKYAGYSQQLLFKMERELNNKKWL